MCTTTRLEKNLKVLGERLAHMVCTEFLKDFGWKTHNDFAYALPPLEPRSPNLKAEFLTFLIWQPLGLPHACQARERSRRPSTTISTLKSGAQGLRRCQHNFKFFSMAVDSDHLNWTPLCIWLRRLSGEIHFALPAAI